MKIKKTTLKAIAELIDAKYVGPANFPITGLNEIHKVEAGDITFVDHPKYYAKALNSAATVVLINKEVVCPEGKALLLHDDPFDAFMRIMRHFRPFEPQTQPISDSAEIGEGTLIMPGSFVGHHTVIGATMLSSTRAASSVRTVIISSAVTKASRSLSRLVASLSPTMWRSEPCAASTAASPPTPSSRAGPSWTTTAKSATTATSATTASSALMPPSQA